LLTINLKTLKSSYLQEAAWGYFCSRRTFHAKLCEILRCSKDIFSYETPRLNLILSFKCQQVLFYG
jgi:hypothetical protein